MDVIKNTIRTLEKHYDFLKRAWKPYPDPNVLDAIRIAISALEKQMPKKQDLEGDGYADGKLVYDTWICPGCRKEYELDYDEYKYCPECGQAIDWSSDVAEETEEE